MVRNEFFEAEIDPRTGGLRAYRDVRLRINRLGQMLAYNPGSRMEADSVTVTQNGTALGEITTTGRLMDEQNNILARFTQRFRAWASRPILEIRTTIQPESPPTGYPWHSFYSMRFLWGDERATLYRGVNATPSFTYHTRPVSPDYVEIRGGKMSTLILSGGLPFFQRHGTKMLDLILIPEGETQRTFDVALAMDRDYPMQVAQGMISPTAIVPTTKGPPSVGNTAWLFHNDAPNLLLLSMKPNPRIGAQDRSIIARFMETSLYGGAATIRGVRNPSGARTLDGTGESLMEVNLADDAVHLDFASGEVLRVEMDYT